MLQIIFSLHESLLVFTIGRAFHRFVQQSFELLLQRHQLTLVVFQLVSLESKQIHFEIDEAQLLTRESLVWLTG